MRTAAFILLLSATTPAAAMTATEFLSMPAPERQAYLKGALDSVILQVRLKESPRQADCLTGWFSRNDYRDDLERILRANARSEAAAIIGIYARGLPHCNESIPPPSRP